MIVEVPLQLWALPGKPTPADLHAALAAAYAGERFVEVASGPSAPSCKARAGAGGYVAALDPEALNGTNRMRLFVFGNDAERRRRGWWPCSTISARARPARRCRTST